MHRSPESGEPLRSMKPTHAGPSAARRSDQRSEEGTSPQPHHSAARHRLREFGRKSLDPRLTRIIVSASISSCSTSKSSTIRRQRRWPWTPCGVDSCPSWPRLPRRRRWPRGWAWLRQKVNYHLHALGGARASAAGRGTHAVGRADGTRYSWRRPLPTSFRRAPWVRSLRIRIGKSIGCPRAISSPWAHGSSAR